MKPRNVEVQVLDIRVRVAENGYVMTLGHDYSHNLAGPDYVARNRHELDVVLAGILDTMEQH